VEWGRFAWRRSIASKAEDGGAGSTVRKALIVASAGSTPRLR